MGVVLSQNGRLEAIEHPMKAMPPSTLSDDEPEQQADIHCVICWEDLFQTERMELRCGHHFHLSCIKTWLSREPTCPCCRQHDYTFFSSCQQHCTCLNLAPAYDHSIGAQIMENILDSLHRSSTLALSGHERSGIIHRTAPRSGQTAASTASDPLLSSIDRIVLERDTGIHVIPGMQRNQWENLQPLI